jgi:hypothetical protein
MPNETDHADIGARVMLVVLCFIWGITWPLMKIALIEIPPFSMRTVTSALGAFVLYLVCRFTGRSLRVPNAKAWAHIIIASLLNVVAFVVLGSFAQLTAATSRVTILAYTMPIWAVVSRRAPKPHSGDRARALHRRNRDSHLPAHRDANSRGNLAGAAHRNMLGRRHRLPEMGTHPG